MADKSAIEWTDATWTPIRARLIDIQNDGSGKERIGWHCEHISDGCRNCYAERINLRLGTGREFKPGELYRADRKGYRNGESKVFLDEKMLFAPLHWKKPRMIFVCSMTDLFADFVPDGWIDRLFAVMALCPQHTFQVLTKRADRMLKYFVGTERYRDVHPMEDRVSRIADAGGQMMEDGDNTHDYLLNADWPLPNVWLGVSTERQKEADERIPALLQTPAAVRFLSAEPLLGNIDLENLAWPKVCDCDDEKHKPSFNVFNSSIYCDGCCEGPERIATGKLSWVIAGGESGPDARPMHPDWARAIRDQCAEAGVPFFFKQWGNWHPEIDRDLDDPDWRQPYTKYRGPHFQILNLAGGRGFHGERVHVMRSCSKKSAGRLLDGIEHNAMPG